ncbi:MAG: hypothetical protein WAV09_00200, partial [Minisyncoccia bacterium]
QVPRFCVHPPPITLRRGSNSFYFYLKPKTAYRICDLGTQEFRVGILSIQHVDQRPHQVFLFSHPSTGQMSLEEMCKLERRSITRKAFSFFQQILHLHVGCEG